MHFLVIVFFFFKPLAPWWSFDDFCQSCVISSDQQNSGCILDFSLSFEFYFSFSLVLIESTNMIMINLGPT